MTKIYIIGSMKNPAIPETAIVLRNQGYEVFDDWYSPGPEADDKWQEYERQRGRTYKEALYGHHAETVFEFDKRHLDECDVGVLVMPAGRSAHMELGYLVGSGKTVFILFDKEPERYDIMTRFARDVFFNLEDLIVCLHQYTTMAENVKNVVAQQKQNGVRV